MLIHYLNSYNRDKPPLILISLDGFRPDYMEKQLTPTLARLHKCGVTTPYMSSIYPTLTFPNHNSIVTVSSLLHIFDRFKIMKMVSETELVLQLY